MFINIQIVTFSVILNAIFDFFFVKAGIADSSLIISIEALNCCLKLEKLKI